jgi:hypothetical protein
MSVFNVGVGVGVYERERERERESSLIIMDRNSPFFIVISNIDRICTHNTINKS